MFANTKSKRSPQGILVTSKSATTLSPSSIYSNRWKACGCYAHLASPELRDAEKRVADIRQMMKDPWLENGHRSVASCYVRSQNAPFVAMPGAPFVASLLLR